jgi:hypothetical protein
MFACCVLRVAVAIHAMGAPCSTSRHSIVHSQEPQQSSHTSQSSQSSQCWAHTTSPHSFTRTLTDVSVQPNMQAAQASYTTSSIPTKAPHGLASQASPTSAPTSQQPQQQQQHHQPLHVPEDTPDVQRVHACHRRQDTWTMMNLSGMGDQIARQLKRRSCIKIQRVTANTGGVQPVLVASSLPLHVQKQRAKLLRKSHIRPGPAQPPQPPLPLPSPMPFAHHALSSYPTSQSLPFPITPSSPPSPPLLCI